MSSSIGDLPIPVVFEQFAGFYYWEAEDGPVTMDELTRQAVNSAATSQRRSIDDLIDFLDTLLDGGATDTDLQRIWDRAQPNWQVRYGFPQAVLYGSARHRPDDQARARLMRASIIVCSRIASDRNGVSSRDDRRRGRSFPPAPPAGRTHKT